MQIETTVYQACLAVFSTNIDATGPEMDKLEALAKRIIEQAEAAVTGAGGKIEPDGFAFERDATITAPVALDVDAADLHNLYACAERVTWPRSRMTEPQRDQLRQWRASLPKWAEQAEAQAALDKLTPEQRKAWAARAAQ